LNNKYVSKERNEVTSVKDLEEFLKQIKISDLSKTTLLLLMKKKDKENKMQKALNFIGIITIVIIVVFTTYFYYKLRVNGGLGSSVLTFIVSDIVILGFLAVLSFLLYSMSYFKRKFDKAEKDVDKIREDIMDRSTEFWKTKEELQERYKVFAYLKDKEDINLFHK
jgi:DMSO/TMAO reductase YedYZ heme-binding membrane subunit